MKNIFLPITILFIWGCSNHTNHHVVTGFYDWKDDRMISKSDSLKIDSINLNNSFKSKIYVKFFDVVYNGNQYNQIETDTTLWGIQPVSTIASFNQLRSIDVVPTIFISNEVFVHFGNKRPKNLAKKIYQKVNRISVANKINWNEMQLDCDWTVTTKDLFFETIKEVKALIAPSKISVTLRLHQYKYQTKCGVPPADRVMLMYYNMSRYDLLATKNSVLDNDVAKQYLTRTDKYPLPMDFALPMFNQAVCFTHRYFYRILNASDMATLKMNNNLNLINGNWYKYVRQPYQNIDSYDFNPLYFPDSTTIRDENVSILDLYQASKLLHPLINCDTFSVVFFHLDKFCYAKYSNYEIKKVVNAFK